MEACFAFVVIFVIIFAILGIAYGFFAATLAIQRIWQRHYHILAKKELTKASQLAHYLLWNIQIFLFSNQSISLFVWWCAGIRCWGSARGLHTTKDGSGAWAAPEDVAALVAWSSANDEHTYPFGATFDHSSYLKN
jgi:hypothetical protein